MLMMGSWIVAATAAFLAVGSTTPRSWVLLVVFALVPPTMIAWLSNQDGPMIGRGSAGKYW
jgi:hypothetical protein